MTAARRSPAPSGPSADIRARARSVRDKTCAGGNDPAAKSFLPVTARRPGGSSAAPNDLPTVARTPQPASSAGIRDVSTSTFS